MLCVAAADFSSKTTKCQARSVESLQRDDEFRLHGIPVDAASIHAIMRDRVEKIILLFCH